LIWTLRQCWGGSCTAAPGRDMADTSGNNANYNTGSGAYPIDSPYYTTLVGEFQLSDSPYGTFDQSGNVFEWNEAALSSSRGLRGGSCYYGSDPLLASYRGSSNPAYESDGLGFRVASSVPEPSTLVMWTGLAATGAFIAWRRRKRGT